MKRKLKKGPKILFVFLGLIGILSLIIYAINTNSVSNSSKIIEFEVKEGYSYTSLAHTLKENNLIKSEFFYKLYIKLNNPKQLKSGIYKLDKNMSVKELVENLEKGTIYSNNLLSITFKEGINMRKIIKIIVENTNIKEEEILNKLKDENYLSKLINNYWFIDESIKNKNIYYSLEGYLFPDTYQIDKTSSIEEIFKIMLDNMNKKITKYKSSIEKSKYNVHQILTLASIVELEAANSDDRAGVAGVFYNRLNSGWSLGSDVTTYYASKVDMSERDLYLKELNDYNAYNTRNSKMAGKLPVSPICIPSIESIEATINPKTHNYYYFVADKNKKTYFNVTEGKHLATISTLKRNDLWYEY